MKRNHQFEKRQLELAKRQKKEEKRLRKLDRAKAQPEGEIDPAAAPPEELPPQ
ncbi:MAG: hypothetical protein HOP28_08025 [Gemmatimonadales bacterium]|nr:hypothetical protein [Gemmatimonadales bacterium]